LNKHKKLAGTGQGELLRSLAEALAPYLQKYLQSATCDSEFYSQLDSPLGKRRHLQLVRRGALPANKVGRLVLVHRKDVHAFIAAHETTASDQPDAREDVLADWGLRRGGQP
jgi:excisionase family DNA binding protein